MSDRVFNDYSLEALDQQYNLLSRHPDSQQYFDRNDSLSRRTRRQLNCSLDIPYGTHALQTLDAFPSDQPMSPVVVFIHGGYWRSLDKTNYSFIADPFVESQCTTFVINYRLAPESSMDEIVADVNSALSWILKHADRFNGDPNSLYLTGHSAGGHLATLAAMLAHANQVSLFSSIKGLLSVSGLFELEPIRRCFLNETVGFDDSIVDEFSPATIDTFKTEMPIIFAVGGRETDEFIRQSTEMDKRMKAIGNQSSFALIPELNHFDIVYELGQDSGVLAKRLLKLIKEDRAGFH